MSYITAEIHRLYQNNLRSSQYPILMILLKTEGGVNFERLGPAYLYLSKFI